MLWQLLLCGLLVPFVYYLVGISRRGLREWSDRRSNPGLRVKTILPKGRYFCGGDTETVPHETTGSVIGVSRTLPGVVVVRIDPRIARELDFSHQISPNTDPDEKIWFLAPGEFVLID